MSVAPEAAAANTHSEGHGHGEGHAHPPFLAHHFDTPAQQFDAAKLGMWAFLGQELLFFSGLFVAYGVYRSWYPEVFTQCSAQLDRTMGMTNTLVLLFSSLTAALAVRSAQLGKKDQTTILLLITIACAFIFLGVKYFEYKHKFMAGLLPGHYFHPIQEELKPGTHVGPEGVVFFSLYFMMTGVHALHIIVGIGVLFWMLKRNLNGEFTKDYFTPVDITALYWHLVDLIWIYLVPLLYLID
ncbi:MAG: cytochrome c oxidase subunit 3 family protein [Polyangiaceae bacterium]